MGAWGTGLYSDDTTSEIRDEFKARLKAGLTHKQAEAQILNRFADVLSDHQIECLVYFALADTLWKYGCLGDDVKVHAVALIDAGGDVNYWQETSSADARSRAKVITQLKKRILSPQPPLKVVKTKVKRPPKKQICAPIGMVFGLKVPSGDIAALKFVGLREGGGSIEEAVFRLLPWRGHEVPNKSTLVNIANNEVMIDDYREFSLYISDRRKNPTDWLVRTDIVLSNATPLDTSRSVSVNIEFLPEKIQEVLSGV
jgi:hypothetical protein